MGESLEAAIFRASLSLLSSISIQVHPSSLLERPNWAPPQRWNRLRRASRRTVPARTLTGNSLNVGAGLPLGSGNQSSSRTTSKAQE